MRSREFGIALVMMLHDGRSDEQSVKNILNYLAASLLARTSSSARRSSSENVHMNPKRDAMEVSCFFVLLREVIRQRTIFGVFKCS